MELEQWLNQLTREQLIKVAWYMSSWDCRQYEDETLIEHLRDVLDEIQTYHVHFKHYPIKGQGVRCFRVSCKGKTQEEAIKNYKQSFDKTIYHKVEAI